jgi:threonine/homoserine/homoserine lactone efflux protein
MGLQTLFHKGGHTTPEAASAPITPPTGRQAVLAGVLTALSNPKGALYFLFLFTSMIPADTPPATKLLIAGMLLTISFGWYSSLALAFSSTRIRNLYQRAGRWMNVAFGSLWIGLGIKLATTTR